MSRKVKGISRKVGRPPLRRVDLYKIAQDYDIPGRSKMKRQELLLTTRSVRKFKRRSLKRGRKRIIVIRSNIAYEVTAKPRKQTKRGKSVDSKTKAKTIIKDKHQKEFGWLGDTEDDVLEYNYAHYDKLSAKEQRLVDKILDDIDRIERYGDYSYSGSLPISSQAKSIAQKKGVTVIEAQHLLNSVEGKGLDPQEIDWDSVEWEDYESAIVAFDEYQESEAEGALEFYY